MVCIALHNRKLVFGSRRVRVQSTTPPVRLGYIFDRATASAFITRHMKYDLKSVQLHGGSDARVDLAGVCAGQSPEEKCNPRKKSGWLRF